MRIYLIRHGKAERLSPTGLDQDRPLAARGLDQAVWLGRMLRKEAPPPSRLFSSPADRAMTTAMFIGKELGFGPEIEEQLGLGTTASAVIEFIVSQGEAGAVALVGHNPTFSTVADVLCKGLGRAMGTTLRTGQAAVLELSEPDDPVGKAKLVRLLRQDSTRID